jgi:hypothetical protein
MPILGNFVRGGGHTLAESGQGKGGIVMPVVCSSSDVPAARAAVSSIVALDKVVAAQLLQVDQSRTGVVTSEKSLRRDDQSFAALLLIEALDSAALEAAADELRKAVGIAEAPAPYDQVFALDRAEMTANLDR